MKVAELMIGDWVLSFPDKCKVDSIICLREVHTAEEKWMAVVHIGGNEFQRVNVGILEPISLTREILERNGFCDTYKDRSLAKDDVFKWYDMYGHCVTVDMNANAIKIQHDSRVLLDLRYNIVVPVHELQHTLRQCGIDKDIEL